MTEEKYTYRKHFEVYPFERKHICAQSPNECLILAGKCYQNKRFVYSQNIEELIDSQNLVQDRVPFLVQDNFFLIRIDFPSSVPLVKLINISGRVLKIRDILREFQKFLYEMYELESLTVEEEKIVLSCTNCVDENFSRFEIKQEGTCPICLLTEEVTLLQLDCNHTICLDCLKRWFAEKNTCPLCRQAIKPCSCKGIRERMITRYPPLEEFFDEGLPTTGVLKLFPISIEDLCFTSLIYDRDSNVFKLVSDCNSSVNDT